MHSFHFGIYPGGEAGSDDGVVSGPPDDQAKVEQALNQLEQGGSPLIVRVYDRFSDADAPSRYKREAPENYARYAQAGRKLDLVAMFQSARGDVDGFVAHLRGLLARHGERMYALQVTEEACFTHGPDAIDGPWPRVTEALVEGVKAAKDEARRLGLCNVLVGFNATPTFGPSESFWGEIGGLGG